MTTPAGGFGARAARAAASTSRLCVGIDPHPYLLEEWGLRADPTGARELGLRTVDAVAGRAAFVKPQTAFFERYGAAGYRALEDVLAAARAAGLIVIADAKRGDVGSTLAAYASAWLTPGAPLEADALTVSAFQGVGSLAAAIGLAREHGKGLFVLAATSNPESLELQSARVEPGGATVSARILEEVASLDEGEEAEWGSFGVVLGATLDLAAAGIDVAKAPPGPVVPVLAPGFGHQGAGYEDARRRYGALAAGLIPNESRGILAAGPRGLPAEVGRRVDEVEARLG